MQWVWPQSHGRLLSEVSGTLLPWCLPIQAQTVLSSDIMNQGLQEPEIINRTAGEVAVLECPVENLDLEPGTIITWERMILPLPIPERANLTCNNETLVITDLVSPDDTDEYVCTVQEPSGRRFQFSTRILVFGG